MALASVSVWRSKYLLEVNYSIRTSYISRLESSVAMSIWGLSWCQALQSFLPDRTPSVSYAKKVIAEQDADRLPIILIEMEHDGPGPPLLKKVTNTSRRKSRRP